MKSPKDMRIIQIDITNACTHRCSNCTRFCGHHRKDFFMDFETFKRAVDSLEGYKGTIGMMGGEPTLHPEFARFLEYLDSKQPSNHKKKENRFIRPQKNFMQSIIMQNAEEAVIHKYSCGNRETIFGSGIWSAMVPSYMKNYELIQDKIRMQRVNDHGNESYHSPILVSRKDLGISDEEWIPMRDNCWIPDVWSANITPKGAFFCEVAGALDMLFDGPGGWSIEQGWWKREQKDYGDQLQWCEICGLALDLFSRNANEEIDDVSPILYEKLQKVQSPRIKKGSVNLLKIENGIIAEESKVGVDGIRKNRFNDDYILAFDKTQSALYPKGFAAVVTYEEYTGGKLFVEELKDNVKDLEKVCVLYKTSVEEFEELKENEKFEFIQFTDGQWGRAFNKALNKFERDRYIFVMNDGTVFNDDFVTSLKELVINPGTMHYAAKDKLKENEYFKKVACEESYVALLHSNAGSMKKMGYDGVANSKSFDEILEKWENKKVITLEPAMVDDSSPTCMIPGETYVIYGTGGKAERLTRELEEQGSTIYAYGDSSESKWGQDIFGKKIMSPQEILEKKKDYYKVIVGSIYFNEIREKLVDIGMNPDDVIYVE